MNLEKIKNYLGLGAILLLVGAGVVEAIKRKTRADEIHANGIPVPALVVRIDEERTNIGRGRGGLELDRKAILTVEYACVNGAALDGITFGEVADQALAERLRAQAGLRTGRVYARSWEQAQQYSRDTVLKILCSGDDLMLAD